MPDTAEIHFTPTQKRMLAVLSDGEGHTREELHACLGDDLASGGAVRVHIAILRKKLAQVGQAILCEVQGIAGKGKLALAYRHVLHLVNGSLGGSGVSNGNGHVISRNA